MTYYFILAIKVRMWTHKPVRSPLVRAGPLQEDESLNPELIKIGFLLL